MTISVALPTSRRMPFDGSDVPNTPGSPNAPRGRDVMESKIRQLCQEEPEVCDILISAFFSAMKSSRASTALVPFPASFKKERFDGSPAKERDHGAIRDAMSECPSVVAMASEDASVLSTLSDETIELLWWILCLEPPSRRFTVRKRNGNGRLGTGEPICVLDIDWGEDPNLPFEMAQSTMKVPPTVAYHGSPGDNWHSILRMGLENRSGGRFERTGAVFGDGVYLSDSHSVAMGFSKPLTGWHRSMHSPNMLAVGIFEIVKHPSVRKPGSYHDGKNQIRAHCCLCPMTDK